MLGDEVWRYHPMPMKLYHWFEESGYMVFAIGNKYIVTEVPLYGGAEVFRGIFPDLETAENWMERDWMCS